MRYTRDHLPILQVVAKAGVDMYAPLEMRLNSTGKTFMDLTPQEEDEWINLRKNNLAAILQKKAARRGGEWWCDGDLCSLSSSSSDDPLDTVMLRLGHN